MGILHCFPEIAAELVRGAASGAQIVATLGALPVNRMRASASYTMQLSMPWVTAHDLLIVSARGYPIAHDLRSVSTWFSKCLPGHACALQIVLPDTATLAVPWTPERHAKQAARVAAIDTNAAREDALQKEATAATWGDKPRRAAVTNAVRAMREAAGIADALTGGPWPDPQQ